MGLLKERLEQRAALRVAQAQATQPIDRLLPVIDPPEAPVIDPLARRLSDVLRDESLSEAERVRLRQIVSLVLADRRRS